MENQYKVNDVVILRRSKRIGTIIEIIEFADGRHRYILKYFDDTNFNDTKSSNWWTKSALDKITIQSPAAKVLYGR